MKLYNLKNTGFFWVKFQSPAKVKATHHTLLQTIHLQLLGLPQPPDWAQF